MNMMMQHRPECPPSAQNWSQLVRCWNDVEEFKKLIESVVNELGYIKNPGVTDGSNAKPGEIGEYYINQVTHTYPTTVSAQSVVKAGILSPGDWLVFATWWPSVGLNGVRFDLSPVPTGVSTGMPGMEFVSGVSTGEGAIVNSQPARASLKSATMFSFLVNTNIWAAGNAGTGTMALQAWRMR